MIITESVSCKPPRVAYTVHVRGNFQKRKHGSATIVEYRHSDPHLVSINHFGSWVDLLNWNSICSESVTGAWRAQQQELTRHTAQRHATQRHTTQRHTTHYRCHTIRHTAQRHTTPRHTTPRHTTRHRVRGGIEFPKLMKESAVSVQHSCIESKVHRNQDDVVSIAWRHSGSTLMHIN